MIDPTREEIEAFLAPHVESLDADKFDVEVAIYWFAYKNHGGGCSNLYEVLSCSDYRPGTWERDVYPDSIAFYLHDLLMTEYRPYVAREFWNYRTAFEALPNGSVWSCSSGNPGEGGFDERWRSPDGKTYVITNGKWDESAELTWFLTLMPE